MRQSRPQTRTGATFYLLARHRTLVQLSADALAWCAALSFATLARYDFVLSAAAANRLPLAIVLAVTGQAVAGLATGLYLGRRRFGSFEEVAILAPATGLVTVGLFLVHLPPATRFVPLSVTLAGGVTALVLMAALRYAWRLTIERRRRPSGDDVGRVVVFGAGDAGAQIVATMLVDPASPYLPVALLDDDPAIRHLRIKGVPVAGTRADLRDVADRYEADTLLIAVPSAPGRLIRELSEAASEAGLAVRVLPPVHELLNGRVGIGDIREVSPADLLGRHEIDTDVAAIASYLMGKRVLVTGAGGSIGSELCRQVYRFAPAELILFDRDESALHATQLALEGRAALDATAVVLADIRDRERVQDVFAQHRPEVVFHAAALKHVTALQQHPLEAVKTNVVGTLNVLAASAASGVDRFVNISTDKAANPVSVLGLTKRIAERLTAHYAETAPGAYLSVRFGNVLGSRGSVLTVFHAQIDAGGPVTVTHPEVTRFFMTLEEAVQLVVQAGAIGADGEALVLDMGEPVKIDQVARRLAEQSERHIDITYTGLRPGEKLHEELFGAGEQDRRPSHPLVSHVSVPPLAPAAVAPLRSSLGADELVALLRDTADAEPGLRPAS